MTMSILDASILERMVFPPEVPLNELATALNYLNNKSTLDNKSTTTLQGTNGEQLVLPVEVFEVLREIVDIMAAGQAVTIVPAHQRLTTQQAAGLLAITHSACVDLLESGELPFKQMDRHRQVCLTDVLAYKQRRSDKVRGSLDRMVDIAAKSGMYERTATPTLTR